MNLRHIPTRRRFLLGVLGFMSACVLPSHAATTALDHVEWVLVEIHGKAVGPAAKGDATLKFDAAKMSAAGRSFVNHYGGKYEMKGNTLKFGDLMCTQMAGEPEAMDAERDYLAMLKDVTGWRITDGKLELLKGDQVVARFSEKEKAKPKAP